MTHAATTTLTASPVRTRSRRHRLLRAELILPCVALGMIAALVAPRLTNAAPDSRLGDLSTTLAHLQDKVDLYRDGAGRGFLPDLAGEGWAPLIRAGYLDREPVNPITGSSRVGHEPSTLNGWCIDAEGRLSACIVDASTGRVTTFQR